MTVVFARDKKKIEEIYCAKTSKVTHGKANRVYVWHDSTHSGVLN